MKILKTGLLATAMLAATATSAYAACPADGAKPFFASPVDPVNGFPTYVEDAQGLALMPCLIGDGATGPCFFDPPVVGNTFSEAIGFGPEAFYWLSQTTIDTVGPSAVSAVLVMGAELAFNTPEPEPGEQFPFTRLRLRMTIFTPGIYTITHPFGQETYVLESAGDRPGQDRVVNDSFDIEFAPNRVNQGRVSPWLTWDTYPTDPTLDGIAGPADGIPEFVGITGVPHAIQGAPCGNNFFRVSAVGLDGVTPIPIDPADQDGNGSTSSVSEVLFDTQGRVFPGNVETPLVVDGVTYSRGAILDPITGQIVSPGVTRLNVHATAPTTAELTVDEGAGPLLMAGEGDGRFFRSDDLGLGTNPPATVTVVATNTAQPNNDTATRIVPVHDIVTVSVATYQPAAGVLDVAAESSDLFVPPTLTVAGFGDLTEAGTLRVTGLNVAPATVTIQSSAGGVTVAPVRVLNP